MADKGAITRNVIIKPYVLRRLYLVNAAIPGSRRHRARVARVTLPTCALSTIVEVLLLRLHHLLLIQLSVVVRGSDAC